LGKKYGHREWAEKKMQALKKIDIDPAEVPVLDRILDYGIYEVFQIGSIYIHNTLTKQTYEFSELNNDIDISPETVAEWLKEIRMIDPNF
jgi:hypothetical protein